MNIFYDGAALFDIRKPVESDCETLWRTIEELKESLGDRSHYMDEYLHHVYYSITLLNAEFMDCFMRVFAEDIVNVCEAVCSGESYFDPVLYDEVKTFIDSHPRDFEKEDTKINYYAAHFMLAIVRGQYSRALHTIKKAIYMSAKCKRVSASYCKIAKITGEEKLDILNDMLREHFIVAPTINVIYQRLINEAMGFFLKKDLAFSNPILPL